MEREQRYKSTSSVVFGCISGLLLFFFSYEPYGFMPKVLAALSSVLIFILIWDLVLNRNIKSLYLFPFITLNWIYFQSPFLLKEKTYYYNRTIREEYINEIAVYCCISIYLIYIAYNFFLNRRFGTLTSLKLRFKDDVLIKVIYVFIILGVMYRVGTVLTPQIISSLSKLIQLLPYSSTIVFGLYILGNFRRQEKWYFSVFDAIVMLFLLSEFLLRLSTTLFSEVAILFSGPLIVYFSEKRKVPIIPIIVSLIILIPLYQTRKYFRLHSTEVQEFSGDEIAKGRVILENAYSLDEQQDYQDLVKRVDDINRFENLSFISHVVLMHKSGIKPFLHGETFYWLPLVPIPRIVFPSKPKNVMSTEVATEYGLRGEVSIASINFPMLVEAYINFGFKGMALMSFLFGIAYKWFATKFGFGIGDLNLIIIINSIKQFTHAEGNITLVFGALIQVFLFWTVIVWFLKLNENNKKLFDVE